MPLLWISIFVKIAALVAASHKASPAKIFAAPKVPVSMLPCRSVNGVADGPAGELNQRRATVGGTLSPLRPAMWFVIELGLVTDVGEPKKCFLA